MIGAELGYRYAGSPLIAEEGEGPAHDFITYTPSTFPGSRLPHVWLKDGSALQDRIGEGYTLLRLGRGADGEGLQRAFEALGAPFSHLDVDDEAAHDLYGYDLLLLRPDLHIVWRGNVTPDSPEELAAIATGHRPH